MAIAVNPEVMTEFGWDCKDQDDKRSFVRLNLEYVTHTTQRKIDPNYIYMPRSVEFKGDLEKATKFFTDAVKKAMKKNKQKQQSEQNGDEPFEDIPDVDVDVPEALMSRLSGIVNVGKDKDNYGNNEQNFSSGPKIPTSATSNPVIFPHRDQTATAKKNLIQEIKSEDSKVTKPHYNIEKTGEGTELTLKIELPGVSSVADCELDISEVSGYFAMLHSVRWPRGSLACVLMGF